ncbi:hypothetical protein AVEN_16355-1 [Araneus ventricosus]|uniref:Tc1-like transposase DDE domain-containing protein n=1 Tax=Araneus ventricosus TaxID=182803 RepID=A0A4Y2GRK0_ARAVE|nr:hypothetical protein AVEN_16355-1 [Araneus ventricosus]
MNYFSVIRPPAGQITQPQSYAFLHGVDWKRSTLARRSLSVTRGWPTSNGTALTPWTPLGFRKFGQFYYPLRSSCVAPGTSLCGPLSWETDRVDVKVLILRSLITISFKKDINTVMICFHDALKTGALRFYTKKVTVWCGFAAAIIVGPFVFEEIGPSGPVTCTVDATRYESLLRNQFIPALQQRRCVDSTIFIQNGAPPHMAKPVKHLFDLHFGNDRIISNHFPTTWPPRSPDLKLCDFFLRG